MFEAAEDHHADEHPKRQLRVMAWSDLITMEGRGYSCCDRLWLRRVLYKMKRDEYSKPGKYPRMIGDLGVAASLQGFYVTKLMKQVMAEVPIKFEYRGKMMVAEFCALPEPENLTRIFGELLEPQTDYYLVYFSDDACLSVRTSEGVYVYNLDIKWCDGSHGDSIFRAMVEITPTHMQADMEILVEQCTLPIEVRDVDDKEMRRRVILKPRGPRLYSGSTVTTFINNVANMMIGLSILEAGAITPLEINRAASTVGYAVSVDLCEQPQDIQFLKHSPVYDVNGDLRAMLNIGVLLRASGACHGDLPGQGEVLTRARMFQNALITGMYPRCEFTLRSNMLRNTQEPSQMVRDVVAQRLEYVVSDTGQRFEVESTELFRRYRLTASEVEEVEIGFGCLPVQWEANESGLEKILTKDYGLITIE
jgi:hypothetical protein